MARRALDTYTIMGIKPANIEFILADPRPNDPIKVNNIEDRIIGSLLAHIPYTSEMTTAIDSGQPFIKAYPDNPISTLVQDMARLLSKPSHQDTTQALPNAAYRGPRPQLSPAGQNGAHHGLGRSLLKPMGFPN